jgi:hypothetical protein
LYSPTLGASFLASAVGASGLGAAPDASEAGGASTGCPNAAGNTARILSSISAARLVTTPVVMEKLWAQNEAEGVREE